ncbi:hypothetical protein BC826DRAFT_712437 [Russula brevipes]|nr:hypothetical protein BC826DRAFT_712437 [Russula brevipes]
MLSVRHVAVAITATLHAISGIFLSVLALSLQRLFPSLQQLPPSSRHISEPVDLPKKHSSPRRDSGYSIHTGTSDGVSSDESLETFPSTPELSPKDSLDNHAALLLASQERARAGRPSGFTPSSLLWPLKEYPSPKPSQLGGEYVAPPLSGVSPDACHSPTVASYRFSVPPQEEQLSEASSIRVKRTRHRHCLPLLPLHRKGSRLLSISHSGRSLRKSSTSPHLREAATLSRKGSPSSHNHRHTSVSEHGTSPSALSNLTPHDMKFLRTSSQQCERSWR